MSAPARGLVLVLVLMLTAATAAAEPIVVTTPDQAAAVNAVEGAGTAPPPAVATLEPPSKLMAMLRAGVATSAVALLLVGVLFGYKRLTAAAAGARARRGGARRWWSRWLPARPAEADRIEVLARTHLGARESLGVVRIGRERLLVGVTPGQISLLTRLEPVEPAPAAAADDFPATLAAVEVTVPRTAEELRRALDRSRERLDRLAGRRVTEKGPRG